MSKDQDRAESALGRQAPEVRRRRLSRYVVLAVLAVALVGGLASVALGGGSVSGAWYWLDGDSNVFVGSPKTGYAPNSLVMQVAGDLNMAANHIRFGATDGNYEFEHGTGSPYTRLNSYYEGTPTRTPIVIGGNDGQDVLSLLVQGKAGQKNDLQDWESGAAVTTAIDGNGDLRINNVVLQIQIVNGRVQLLAQLPDGSTQVLAIGTPQT